MGNILGYLWGVLARPKRTFAELARLDSLRYSAALVTSIGILMAAGFLRSYLARDWPPPAEELAVWIAAWGEFSQLPFLKIPIEAYRGFQAIIMIPMLLAVWMLMAGTARLLGRLFGGRVSFDQYLNLLAFSYFTFWALAAILDTSFNIGFGERLMPALQGAYGAGVQGFAVYFEPVMYVGIYCVAGGYNGWAACIAEKQAGAPYNLWKAALVGLLTFAWPMILSSTLLR